MKRFPFHLISPHPRERTHSIYHNIGWLRETYEQEATINASDAAKLGIKTGDRVIIYMPMVPELVFAVLACARIGATHSVIFGGFSAEAIRDRFAPLRPAEDVDVGGHIARRGALGVGAHEEPHHALRRALHVLAEREAEAELRARLAGTREADEGRLLRFEHVEVLIEGHRVGARRGGLREVPELHRTGRHVGLVVGHEPDAQQRARLAREEREVVLLDVRRGGLRVWVTHAVEHVVERSLAQLDPRARPQPRARRPGARGRHEEGRGRGRGHHRGGPHGPVPTARSSTAAAAS